MKIIPSKKQFAYLLQVIFWFISFNCWTVILNPGVESTSVIQGFEVEWDSILFLNFLFLIYCSLPCIWLIRKARLWVKIPVTMLFFLPIAYVVFQAIHPTGNKDEVEAILEYFLKNFLYVIVFHLTIIAAVYFNLKVLIVRFLSQSRFGLYLSYVSGLCLVAALLNFALFDYGIDLLFPSLYYISCFKVWELILIVAAYLVFTSTLFLVWQYAQMLIANRDAARNELSALKAQINPHFLFNNLNTIYSMATTNDARTSDVILKLSDFLRYVLYDTGNETIPLEKEVEIIRTYVGLQKERIDLRHTPVDLITEGNFDQAKIAPLLLLPLAENCFKHGVGKDPGSIRLFIKFDGKQLLFKTENKVSLREKPATENNGRIGIKNVEKRLNLIYPENHSIEYQVESEIFRLELKIELTTRIV